MIVTISSTATSGSRKNTPTPHAIASPVRSRHAAIAEPPRAAGEPEPVPVEPGGDVGRRTANPRPVLDDGRVPTHEVAANLGPRSDHEIAVDDDDVLGDRARDLGVPVQDDDALADRALDRGGTVQDDRHADGLALGHDERTVQDDLVVGLDTLVR
jgi:hypothetical protein